VGDAGLRRLYRTEAGAAIAKCYHTYGCTTTAALAFAERSIVTARERCLIVKGWCISHNYAL
jgi:hypothetical protein